MIVIGPEDQWMCASEADVHHVSCLVVDVQQPVKPPSVTEKLDLGYLESENGLLNRFPSAFLDPSHTPSGMYVSCFFVERRFEMSNIIVHETALICRVGVLVQSEVGVLHQAR